MEILLQKPGTIATVVVAVVVLYYLIRAVQTVPQGYNYTYVRFRKYAFTLQPGLTLINPLFTSVGAKMNVMEQVLDIPTQEVITKDNASVAVDGVAFYQVVDAAKAAYEVANLNSAILNLLMTNIRTVMGSLDLDQLLSHRDEINVKLLVVVDAATTSWGVKVTRVEIKDIVPPADLIAAMGRQMKAEREKRAVILEAEGQRQSEILKAEGQKQSKVLEAEGRKEAAFRDAEARERSAQAEATATTVVSEAIAKGDTAALNYFIADKYVKAFQALATANNQKVLILPMEATALIGSLAGIGEIAKATFGDANTAPRRTGSAVPRVERTQE